MTPAPGQMLMRLGTLGVMLALVASAAGWLTGTDALIVAVIAVPLIAFVALVIGPAAAYAIARRRNPHSVPRGLRVTALASAVVIVLIGLLYSILAVVSSAWPGLVFFGLVTVVGASVALRARKAPVHEATDPGPPLRAYLVPFVVGCALSFGSLFQHAQVTSRSHTRELSYRAAMRSDLRNIHYLQRDAFADSGHYTVAPDFTSSSGVTEPEIQLTDDGWTARVAHAAITMECVIFEGSTPVAPADTAGRPTCTGDAERARSHRRADLTVLGIGLALGMVAVWSARVSTSPAAA